jgi:hypothetical protein
MKKIKIITLFMILNSFMTLKKDVYICGSQGAKKYHFSKSCRGLSACKHEITKTTEKDAQNLGLDLCGWED